jgi:hypothetical protein
MAYDDDLEDYTSPADEEFDEEALSNEEYDKLHEVLAELKQLLKDYNDEIPEFDLKEALYFNYYEVPDTIDEIKSRFKKSMYI